MWYFGFLKPNTFLDLNCGSSANSNKGEMQTKKNSAPKMP